MTTRGGIVRVGGIFGALFVALQVRILCREGLRREQLVRHALEHSLGQEVCLGRLRSAWLDSQRAARASGVVVDAPIFGERVSSADAQLDSITRLDEARRQRRRHALVDKQLLFARDGGELARWHWPHGGSLHWVSAASKSTRAHVSAAQHERAARASQQPA